MSKEEASAVAGTFWSLSPVVVITSAAGDDINGQVAVTAVTSSIVHSVPRLIVGIWKGNYTHSFITRSGAFTIHLLRTDQLGLVRNFGFYTGRERDKFQGVDYETGITGSPVLLDVHSYAECRVINAMDGGDMTVFLVSVVDGKVLSGGEWMTLNHFYTYAPEEWIDQYGERLSQSVANSMGIIHNIDYTPWRVK